MDSKVKNLPNGMTFISNPLADSNSVTILVLIKAGSVNESIPGLAHFIEHTILKGSKKRPTSKLINFEVEKMGGYINAATSQEFTEFFIKIPYEFIENGFDIISDILFNPIFEDIEIEKEKDVVIEEINMYEDTPIRKVSDTFYNLIWKDNPLGMSILGTEDTIKSIQRRDIISFINQYYLCSNMILSVAGRIDVNKINDLVDRYFLGNLKPAFSGEKDKFSKVVDLEKSKYSSEKINIQIEDKKLKQVHLCFGVNALNYLDERMPILEVASGIIAEGSGSFLWQKIREDLSASYYLSAEIDSFKSNGVWYIHAGVEKDKLNKVIEIILQSIKKLIVFDFDKEEVNRAKEYIKGELSMNLEGSEEFARYNAYEFFEHGCIKSTLEQKKLIEDVSIDSIGPLVKELYSNKIYFNIIGNSINYDIVKEVSEKSISEILL